MKPQALVIDEQCKILCDKANIQEQIVEECIKKGDKNIYFCNGCDFLGNDFDECTVEGVHFSDLGFMRMANSLQPVIERILGI